MKVDMATLISRQVLQKPAVKDRLLPTRPKLLKGESLTSWISRLAEAYSLSISEFLDLTGLSGCKNQSKFQDPDIQSSLEMLSLLARFTGSKLQNLKNATCRSALSRLEDCHSKTPRANSWVLRRPHLVKIATPSSFGLEFVPSHGFQFCPSCLSAPGPAFLRVNWRYSFVTVCEVHGCLLQSRCGHCESLIDFSFAALKSGNLPSNKLVSCPYCLHNYVRDSRSDSSISPSQIGYLIHQQSVHLDLLQKSSLDASTVKYYFDFLKWLIKSFYPHCPRYDLSRLGRGFLADLAGLKPLIAEEFSYEVSTLRSYPALERAKLLLMSSHLLDPWPSHFSVLQTMAPPFHRRFLRRYKSSPPWLTQPKSFKPLTSCSGTLTKNLAVFVLHLAGCNEPTFCVSPLALSIQPRTKLPILQRRRDYLRRLDAESKTRRALAMFSGATLGLPKEYISPGYEQDYRSFGRKG
jgi:hypothetical protein